MSYVQEEYLRKASYLLKNFRYTGNHVYRFSCPFCALPTEKSSRSKSYAFSKNNELIIWCHKCNHSYRKLGRFLKEIDHDLYKQFIFDEFKFKNQKIDYETVAPSFDALSYIPDVLDSLDYVWELPEDHIAIRFALSRKLPTWFDFRYVENFYEWCSGFTDKFSKITDMEHDRLVIPFRDSDGRFIGFTARAFKDHPIKYIRYFLDKNVKQKFFGLDRLDTTNQIYVLEGEIDSLMIPNAVAVSNAHLMSYFNRDAIYIPDRDVRNSHIMKGVKTMIDTGLKVCLLPDNHLGKDLNEMIINGMTEDSIIDLINSNTFQGLSAILKYNQWRQI